MRHLFTAEAQRRREKKMLSGFVFMKKNKILKGVFSLRLRASAVKEV